MLFLDADLGRMQDLKKLVLSLVPSFHGGLKKELPEPTIAFNYQLDNVAACRILESSLQSLCVWQANLKSLPVLFVPQSCFEDCSGHITNEIDIARDGLFAGWIDFCDIGIPGPREQAPRIVDSPIFWDGKSEPTCAAKKFFREGRGGSCADYGEHNYGTKETIHGGIDSGKVMF